MGGQKYVACIEGTGEIDEGYSKNDCLVGTVMVHKSHQHQKADKNKHRVKQS